MYVARKLPSLARASSARVVANASASSNAKSFAKLALQQTSNFSTLIEKERGEEARFIRQEEAKRQAELKLKVEAILAQADDHAQKANILEIIEGTEKKGFLAKYGLNQPFMVVPIAAAVIVPLISKGIFIFNEETYVLLSFGLFFGTVITQAGPVLAKEFDESIQNIRDSLKKVDDSLKQNIVDEAEQVKELVGVDKTVGELHSLVDNLSTAQAEALNAAAEHKFSEVIAKKLDTLVALENAAAGALRQRALTEVRAEVLNSFKNDKKVKEAALNQALAVLAGGPNTKNGKDIVGETFVAAVKSYRENYSKQAPGSDKIIAALEKDIAAVLEEPVFEEKGGNVYVTHPVSQRFVA